MSTSCLILIVGIYYEMDSRVYRSGTEAKREATRQGSRNLVPVGARDRGRRTRAGRLAQLLQAVRRRTPLPPEKRQAHLCGDLAGKQRQN